jgi:hypothetical protein
MTDQTTASRPKSKRTLWLTAEMPRSAFISALLGITIVLAGLAGCAASLYQAKQQNIIVSTPIAAARIVSATRERNESTRFTDALVDYVRQTANGPVDCRNSPARLMGWSAEFDVGNTVMVYPQAGSCYQPIYALDIGDPGRTLNVSLITLLAGSAVLGLSYLFARRRMLPA